MHTPEEVLKTLSGRALLILFSNEGELGVLIRQELLNRLEPPVKRLGRPPKIEKTGEFTRSRPAPKQKGQISPEGRARMIAGLRKYWARKRKGKKK